MEYTYVPPPLPTIRRWKNLYRRFPGESVLRAIEYEHPIFVITGYRGPFSRLRFHLTHISDCLYAKLTFRGDRYDGKRGERICGIAPGYFIKATR